ncbi:SRPBCC domain-containing protein [Streptomyces sp. NPDC050264]|uniref:SRPBCC domain-containing protein n=1 Tax=Streptomyces sp. NPDC050264 TaxID=3155038 RepID=UPI0034182A85
MSESGGKEFEISRLFEVGAGPEQVWDAVTSGTGGWLWPMKYEPKQGGAGPYNTVLTVWDPPRRLGVRSRDPAALPPFQTLNQLDYRIEPRNGGSRARVRYVHSGVFTDNWDELYEGVAKHTDFYMHTLRQYVTYFVGRPVAFTTVNGPVGSVTREALTVVARALCLPDDATEGARVRAQGPFGRTLDVVLDYRNAYFIGLRTDDAFYRIFGRGPWGAPLGISIHDFTPGADARRNQNAWSDWLASVFP